MRKRLIITLATLLLAGLLLGGGVLAMNSTNYRLDWFTPMSSGGGGPAASSNYGANLTVGQTAIDLSASAGYQAGLGYWQGVGGGHSTYLPLLLGN